MNSPSSNGFIDVPCVPVTQPIGPFFVGVMDWSDLVEIAFASEQTIAQGETDSLLGIERPLKKERVDEIGRYVNNVDATFPTSIIVAVSSNDASYDEGRGTLRIARRKDVAEIIDGQHRIAGLKSFHGDRFQCNVTVFVDMDIEDRATVFATINLKQTRVTKSMAYNLYEYATTRSPQKACHDIAKFLNSRHGSPLEHRIKILGTATEGRTAETLTQAAFVDQLVRLLSADPDKDRDILKRGRELSKVKSADAKKLVFRNMFIEGKEAEIARVLWNYFAAVASRWTGAWNSLERGMLLNRTTGFVALMRLLPAAYEALGELGRIVEEETFERLFLRVPLNDGDFNSDRYPPGSAGQSRMFQELLRYILPS